MLNEMVDDAVVLYIFLKPIWAAAPDEMMLKRSEFAQCPNDCM